MPVLTQAINGGALATSPHPRPSSYPCLRKVVTVVCGVSRKRSTKAERCCPRGRVCIWSINERVITRENQIVVIGYLEDFDSPMDLVTQLLADVCARKLWCETASTLWLSRLRLTSARQLCPVLAFKPARQYSALDSILRIPVLHGGQLAVRTTNAHYIPVADRDGSPHVSQFNFQQTAWAKDL